MDDDTKQKKLATPADFLRHAEALIKFEADHLGKAHTPSISSLEALAALAPAAESPESAKKAGGIVKAFPGARKKKDPSS